MTFWINLHLAKKILVFRRLTLFWWSRSRSSDQQACLTTSFQRNSGPSQGRQCEFFFSLPLSPLSAFHNSQIAIIMFIRFLEFPLNDSLFLLDLKIFLFFDPIKVPVCLSHQGATSITVPGGTGFPTDGQGMG